MLAVSDFSSGMGGVIQGLGMLIVNSYQSTQKSIFVSFYIITQVSFHVSAFLNVMLTTVRSISIFLPFYVINKRAIILSTVLYTLAWFFFVMYEWIGLIFFMDFSHEADIAHSFYVYSRPLGLIIHNIVYKIAPIPVAQKITSPMIITLAIGIAYGIPSLISLLCGITQSIFLFRRTQMGQSEKKPNKTKRMYKTILILTVVFFICNTTYLLISIVDDKRWARIQESVGGNYVLVFSSNHLFYLNSLLTPLILIIRGSSLRLFTLSKVGVKSSYMVGASLRTSFRLSG